MKAEWGTDYDFRTDTIYKCPVCMGKHCRPYGGVPIGIAEDGKYRCINCGEEMELDADMKEWIDKRSETKTEKTYCFKCDEETMVTVFHRNDVTLEWQMAYGTCEKCGCKFIV